MDIKATQLKNNTQIKETASSSVRTPAKVTEEGKSFVDAMADLPKIDTENSVVQKNVTEIDTNKNVENNSKSFEFVSKNEKEFNCNVDQNKKLMTAQERQEKHRVAEKELVDEIVLMNNKHNSEIKNTDKNESIKSEIVAVQKSDKQVDVEKFEVLSDTKPVSKPENVHIENNNMKSEIPQNENILTISEKELPQDKFEIAKSDIKNNEVELLQQNTVEPEILKIADGEVEETLLPDKNVKAEVFPKPEILEKFEEPKLIENEINAAPEMAVKDDKVDVIVKPVKEEISKNDKNVISKSIKTEEKSIKTEEKSLKTVEEVLPEKTDIKPSKVENIDLADKNVNISENNVKIEKDVKENFTPKSSKVENIDLSDKNVNISENNVKIEKDVKENFKPKSSKVEKTDVQKQDSVKIQNTDEVKTSVIAENEVVQEVKSFEKPEKVAFVENLINQNKIDEKKDLKGDKPTISKISNIKKDVLNEVENVGKVKDIADETKVNAVEMRPVVPQDIKVIKMEVINPLAELNNSMNTNKTSDIVKFIDANLSTDTVKTAKSRSTKSSEAAKKSSEKSIKMTEADAKFFNNLIEVNQQVIEGTKTADQTNNNLLKDVEAAKSAQVSKTLLNALKESQETNKAFRVDFDKDISVVLRVNKDGQISAEFLPGDEAVEQYLKANIPLLKQKFTDEGLEYDNLSYRQHKKDNEEEKQRQQRGNKKENGYE